MIQFKAEREDDRRLVAVKEGGINCRFNSNQRSNRQQRNQGQINYNNNNNIYKEGDEGKKKCKNCDQLKVNRILLIQ